jgi:hypothetical protein
LQLKALEVPSFPAGLLAVRDIAAQHPVLFQERRVYCLRRQPLIRAADVLISGTLRNGAYDLDQRPCLAAGAAAIAPIRPADAGQSTTSASILRGHASRHPAPHYGAIADGPIPCHLSSHGHADSCSIPGSAEATRPPPVGRCVQRHGRACPIAQCRRGVAPWHTNAQGDKVHPWQGAAAEERRCPICPRWPELTPAHFRTHRWSLPLGRRKGADDANPGDLPASARDRD